MSRDKRKQIIQDIEKKRDSKVITYITSDRANLQVMISHDVVSIIHDHILMLKEKARAKLDLFIYSRGGASDVPWTISLNVQRILPGRILQRAHTVSRA
jgi:hypothetical protein